MYCICDSQHLSENHKEHSIACDEYTEKQRTRELKEKLAWLNQDKPCSGSGYAHAAHGACSGYSTDRT